MHQRLRAAILLGAVMIAGTTVLTFAGQLAGGGPDYDLSWNTIDGGGGTSTGGTFALSGTIGQPDAGGALTGGTFELTGGFWPGAGSPGIQCEGDANSSGAVDVDDLIAVVLGWGACPDCPPAHCASDVAPFPNGNCATDVDDLISVILHWGACP